MARHSLVLPVAIALLCLGSLAQAITIEVVTVGDPGNAADDRVMDDSTTGYGSVAYTYSIGKYEVTAAQYTAFLNAVAVTDSYGLYNASMTNTQHGSGISRGGSSGSYSYTVDAAFVDRPVNNVSYWDACRFTNWLHNGQPTGLQDVSTTERGAYNLDGYNGQDGRNIQRNANWKWVVTSEDEWYKAAYYKGGGTNAGYWLYPTHSDSGPGRDLADTLGSNANYYGNPCPIQSPYYTTVVGEFQNSESAYGTFDQGGNVWEWNEGIPDQGAGYASRGLRGGSWSHYGNLLQASFRTGYHLPTSEYSYNGFRVSAVVPEPSSLIALGAGLASLLGVRRRKT